MGIGVKGVSPELIKLDQELAAQFPHLTPEQRLELVMRSSAPGAMGGIE